MSYYIDEPKKIPFEKAYLDPNNPRSPNFEPDGYDDQSKIFPDDVQAKLEKLMEELYDIPALEKKILNQGWIPTDPIFAWEHPKKLGHFVITEGNSRTTALRHIRRKLAHLEEKFEKLKKKKGVDQADLDAAKEEMAPYEAVVEATKNITVTPIKAKNSEELHKRLPILLGVRHISPSIQWSPFARNAYQASLYWEQFHAKHGAKAKRRLDDEIIEVIKKIIPLSAGKIKRNIQAAEAYRRFKRKYEDELPKNPVPLDTEAHLFFEMMLDNPWAGEQFGFKDTDLHLSDEMEEVLFKWAFKKSKNGDENPNIFYQPKNIRLWAQIKKYDDENGTSFASQIDVSKPDSATPMKTVEALYKMDAARSSAEDLLSELVKQLDKMPASKLKSHASHLKPQFEQIIELCQDRLKMIRAIG